MKPAIAILSLALLCVSAMPALATDPTDPRFGARASLNPAAGADRTQAASNQAAFQSAVDVACGLDGDHVLQIPAGIFELDPSPVTIGVVTIRGCEGLSIRGAGRVATTVRMLSDVAPAGQHFLFNIEESTDVEMYGLTLDGSRNDVSGPAARTDLHLVRASASSGLDFHDMAFVNGFGDGITFELTSDVSVSGSSFRNLAGGGITSRSGNGGFRIIGNSFQDIADRHVGSVGIGSATIIGNTFGPHGTGSVAVVELSEGIDVVFSNNNVVDGTVRAINMERGTIASNTLAAKTGLVLNLKSSVVSITGNIITSEGTGDEELCLRGVAQSTTAPLSNWSVVGNMCRHAGPGGIFYLGGFGPVSIAGNTIVNIGSRANATGIVVSELGSEPLRGFAVTGNSIMEEMTGIIISASHGGSIDSGAIVGNTIVSSQTNAMGINTQWSDHQGSPAPVKCRVDANVIDVPGIKIRNSGTTVGAAPGEGCVPHGDQVPSPTI